jgi:DNA-binding GntR family transcriptional regulator
MKVITPEPSASLRTTAEIRRAILDGSLPPGTRVRQEDLAAQLGVSREPVRKALAVLEQEGLVHNDAHSRAVIAPIDPSFLMEIYEFREIVEAYTAERAAQKGIDAKALGEIIVEGRKAVQVGKVKDLIDLDLRFHDQLYLACGNRVVIEVMRAQWSHIRRAMTMTLKTSEYRDLAWDEHEAILDAIMSGKAGTAGKLASAHARNARIFISRKLGRVAKLTQEVRL